jgi:hypothetical protein
MDLFLIVQNVHGERQRAGEDNLDNVSPECPTPQLGGRSQRCQFSLHQDGDAVTEFRLGQIMTGDEQSVAAAMATRRRSPPGIDPTR